MNNRSKEMIAIDDSILVVVDIQEKLLPLIDGKDEIVETTVKLARFARIIGLPVIVTEQEKLGSTVPEIGSETDGLSPITKIDFDAGRCDGFIKKLEESGRKNVIITGIESHICIAQTAMHLLPEYNVHIISDAVGSRTAANKEVALRRLESAGAVISSSEMVIYELLIRAGTPEFKETLKLVK